MGVVLKLTLAAAGAPRIVSEVTGALQAAGHAEATESRAGFDAGYQGGRVIVWSDLGDHAEGHFDSPGQHAARARLAGAYRQSLEAAGWAVNADADGEGMTVTGRAETSPPAVDYLSRLRPWAGDPDQLPPF